VPDRILPWERPLGATPLGDGRVRFRVWAPHAQVVHLRLGGEDLALREEGHGVLGVEARAGHGDDYAYVLDGSVLPDPCSRWQPEGLRGPSRVVDPARFAWTDEHWHGLPLASLVLYELHVGTFSVEGTFAGAIPHLRGLRELGVTAIELMPVAAMPGERGWGYDGVYHWAVHEPYGGPDGLAALVDAAHGEGLAVLLDVVYNHVGASGNKALTAFGPYFTDRYATPWGEAVNFDGEGSEPVREWVAQGAQGLVGYFHLDGLRLDAIHAIYDSGARPLLAELGRRVRRARPGALVIAESGLNDPQVIRPAEVGGLGLDAAWADDFHHALRTLLTDEREGYYAEFGDLEHLGKAMIRPHVHDGTFSTFRDRRHGAPADDRPVEQFVVFAQNHDQVGNRAFGDRLPPKARRLAAFATLLSPFTPMLFMGEEYGEPNPFLFFADHIDDEIAVATREGRRREFASFAAFAGEEVPDPMAVETFERSRLSREEEPGLRDLYRALLGLRPALRGAEARVIDQAGGRLVVGRGDHALAMNFSDGPVALPEGELVLSTHGLDGGDLPPLAGAAVRA
jgi:maltooligosyltrehalose trehalohydrolase